MKELDCQKLVVDAVREGGGFAFKMSNRFLVGIPDLFIHSPEYGTSLWEVKLRDAPKDMGGWCVYITAKQDQKLREYTKAGGFCGVISFVEGSDVRMAVFPYSTWSYSDQFVKRGWTAGSAYTVLPRGKREQTIRELLVKAHYAKEKVIAASHEPQGHTGFEEN